MDGFIKNDVDLELTEQEYKDTNIFLNELLNNYGYKETLQNGVKFMRAKKFNISNAVELYVRYTAIRSKENLDQINPIEKCVLKELNSEKFTFLLKPDKKTGASICVFTAKLHFPSLTTHQNTLKALIFQLDSALSTVSAQKNGLIFIYNMIGSLYSNFDLQLSFKILNLLKGAYPARLCKVIILTPPLWFRASFNFLRVFVREKLQDRIFIVTTIQELQAHVDESVLPPNLNGTTLDASNWTDTELHRQWLQLAFVRAGYSTHQGLNGQIRPTSGTADDLEQEEPMNEEQECDLSRTRANESEEEFELMSEDSWELNLAGDNDDDVLEENGCEVGDNGGDTLVENTPNNKTPKMNNFKFEGFGTKLRRRNAVRQSESGASYLSRIKGRCRLPSWTLYRPGSDEPSLHEADKDDENLNGVTIDEFVNSDTHSIYSTLNEFRLDSVYGEVPQFTSYMSPINQSKNRYSDINCTESSRVKLIRPMNIKTPIVIGLANQPIKPTDYIHANWVDGYRQKNAYICAQGPLSTTLSDFWHMIVQYRIPIIVMTTRPREQNRDKCFQYWPEVVGESKKISGPNSDFDEFLVTNLKSREFGPSNYDDDAAAAQSTPVNWYRVTLLHVKNLRTQKEHRVNHFYFHSWPDQGIPQSTEAFLNFILQIRHTYRMNISKLGYESEMDQSIAPPPILVHCSAGIGRTGTYVVIDICSKSLSDCGRFQLHETMIKVRSQRHKCVQNAYQYLFCRNAIIDYAREMGLLRVEEQHSERSVTDPKENNQSENINQSEVKNMYFLNQSDLADDFLNESDSDDDFCDEIPEVELEEEVYDESENEEAVVENKKDNNIVQI